MGIIDFPIKYEHIVVFNLIVVKKVIKKKIVSLINTIMCLILIGDPNVPQLNNLTFAFLTNSLDFTYDL